MLHLQVDLIYNVWVTLVNGMRSMILKGLYRHDQQGMESDF